LIDSLTMLFRVYRDCPISTMRLLAGEHEVKMEIGIERSQARISEPRGIEQVVSAMHDELAMFLAM
jgi:hypothetical protein